MSKLLTSRVQSLRQWAFVCVTWAVQACSGPPADPPSGCTGGVPAPIWGADGNGSTHGQLPPEQELAVGALQAAAKEVLCTGTLIAPRWVLSAAHCSRSHRLWFTSSSDGQAVVVPVVRTFPHPTRDIALFELERESPLASFGVRTIHLFQGDLTPDWVGRSVTLGGFGATETGQRGVRRFIVEAITAVSEEEIVVDGEGTRGACFGDSGGPLLGNTPGELLGVLSTGSTSCVGVDRYEPVPAIHDWVQATIAQARLDSCGEFDWEGTCSSDGTTYCDGENLVTETCEGKQYCGYDVEANGYRCVSIENDPCDGVGPVPQCHGDLLLRCDAGRLIERDCSLCGQTCGFDDEEATCQ